MDIVLNEFRTKSLSGNTIKLIAIIAMIIDHTGWAFVNTNSVPAAIMHTIGKMTGPIMFYFIAEGNHYSKDKKKYVERLALFAVISHIPYNLFVNEGTLTLLPTSVIFTLMCGLLALIVYEKVDNILLKTLLIIVLISITYKADWALFGVIYILFFGIYYGDFRKQMISYAGISGIKVLDIILTDGGLNLYMVIPRVLSVILVIGVLSLYNGTRGGSKNSKWLFYIIYPLQFLIIGGLALVTGFR